MKVFLCLISIFLFNSHAYSFGGSEGVQSLYRDGYGLQINVKKSEGLVFKKDQKLYAINGKVKKYTTKNNRFMSHYTTSRCELHLNEASKSNQILKKNRKINLIDVSILDFPDFYNNKYYHFNGPRDHMTRRWEFDVHTDDRSFAKLIVKKSYSCWYGCENLQERFVERDLTISSMKKLCPTFNVKRVKLKYRSSL